MKNTYIYLYTCEKSKKQTEVYCDERVKEYCKNMTFWEAYCSCGLPIYLVKKGDSVRVKHVKDKKLTSIFEASGRRKERPPRLT